MKHTFAIFAAMLLARVVVSEIPPTPLLGWNSYDSFGDSVTEKEIMANATYLKESLLAHGWNYVVVDFRWYDPKADSGDRKNRAGATLTADAFGRLLPAPNRFPSSVDGNGFKTLAGRVHAMGLKFGIHVMRGIPQQAVKANTPIEGSSFHALDAANTDSTCEWCPDMFGVKADQSAGQAWYDSLLRLYAAWGVDYIKVDDLSKPYSAPEIEAITQAIKRCGRTVVFSTSPGATPLKQANHIRAHANLWRISADFWDNWKSLDHDFDLLWSWQSYGGPRHWPDADMIPLGRVGKRCLDAKGEHMTHFTRDEQVTLMSLWALAPSPLMLGMNLPENDEWTLGLLTNDEVLAINQDMLCKPATCVWRKDSLEVWLRVIFGGGRAVGIFNRSDQSRTFHDLALAGVTGNWKVRDVWSHQDLPDSIEELSIKLLPHSSRLFKLSPVN